MPHRFRLRRVDAAKTVPHRGGGAGGQHRENARVLIVAVERDPRTRGQMMGAFWKDNARPLHRRDLDSGRVRQREFAGAGRELIAIGIGEMDDGRLQHVFNSLVSRRAATLPILTSIEEALAITISSAIHHSLPAPCAKSLVTY